MITFSPTVQLQCMLGIQFQQYVSASCADQLPSVVPSTCGCVLTACCGVCCRIEARIKQQEVMRGFYTAIRRPNIADGGVGGQEGAPLYAAADAAATADAAGDIHSQPLVDCAGSAAAPSAESRVVSGEDSLAGPSRPSRTATSPAASSDSELPCADHQLGTAARKGGANFLSAVRSEAAGSSIPLRFRDPSTSQPESSASAGSADCTAAMLPPPPSRAAHFAPIRGGKPIGAAAAASSHVTDTGSDHRVDRSSLRNCTGSAAPPSLSTHSHGVISADGDGGTAGFLDYLPPATDGWATPRRLHHHQQQKDCMPAQTQGIVSIGTAYLLPPCQAPCMYE